MEQSTVTPSSIISLDCVPAGANAIIAEVQGGRDVFSRLATLGFTPGAALTMIQNMGRGPLIVAIRSARIALGRGEACHIRVQLDRPTAAGGCHRTKEVA
jgi:ferrous iron transport protein A